MRRHVFPEASTRKSRCPRPPQLCNRPTIVVANPLRTIAISPFPQPQEPCQLSANTYWGRSLFCFNKAYGPPAHQPAFKVDPVPLKVHDGARPASSEKPD